MNHHRRKNQQWMAAVVFVLVLAVIRMEATDAFLPVRRTMGSSASTSTSSSRVAFVGTASSSSVSVTRRRRAGSPGLFMTSEPIFYNDFDDFPDSNSKDDDDDDVLTIDADSLGDWRMVRRTLAAQANPKKSSTVKPKQKTVSMSNEQVLQLQNKKLAQEYKRDLWAHETSTPEVGGLVVRMPLEAELRRNYRHSIMGQKLREKLKLRLDVDYQKRLKKRPPKQQPPSSLDPAAGSNKNKNNGDNTEKPLTVDDMELAIWYSTAQTMVDEAMMEIADQTGDDGQLDATNLDDESAEVLQLYLDHQETWQEVCLVLEHDTSKATTLVLNRPMALQLTDSLGKLVLYGTFQGDKRSREVAASADVKMKDFLRAFGSECAVYVGGPDEQHLPAILVHGLALEGATELAPGTGLYQGGLKAAVEGVLAGKYKPLEFRFFVGRHCFSVEEQISSDDEDDIMSASSLDLEVVLGKYQPVACARSLALKQCIQLPKPLWHEVLELCGGELGDISELELLKKDDMKFQIVDEDDDDDDDGDYDIVSLDENLEFPDELDELYDDDDDDDFYKV